MEENMISLQEVSQELGITYQGVNKWLKKLGLSKIKKGQKNFLTQESFQKIKEARSQNKRNSSVAVRRSSPTAFLEPAITILADTIGALKGELTTKNEQIAKLNQTVDELIERDRETNILIKSFQDKLFAWKLPTPESWIPAPDGSIPVLGGETSQPELETTITEVQESSATEETQTSVEPTQTTAEETTSPTEVSEQVEATPVEESVVPKTQETPTQTVVFNRDTVLEWLTQLEKEELKSIWTEMTLLLRK